VIDHALDPAEEELERLAGSANDLSQQVGAFRASLIHRRPVSQTARRIAELSEALATSAAIVDGLRGHPSIQGQSVAATRAALERAADDVEAKISRTDSKATSMLTAVGVPFAVLLALHPSHLPLFPQVLMISGWIGLLVALVLICLVLRPTLCVSKPVGFVRWAQLNPLELGAHLAEEDTAESVVLLSRLALRKYTWLRWSIHVTVAAVVVLAAALAATYL
jgi:hypothetical protein